MRFVDPKKFEGLNMRQAVTKQLTSYRQPQTTAQVAQAMKDGGMKKDMEKKG